MLFSSDLSVRVSDVPLSSFEAAAQNVGGTVIGRTGNTDVGILVPLLWTVRRTESQPNEPYVTVGDRQPTLPESHCMQAAVLLLLL
jgi:hypothetical protein